MSNKNDNGEFFGALARNIANLLELAAYRDVTSNTTANRMVSILNTRSELSKAELWILIRSARELRVIDEDSRRAVKTAADDLRYLLRLEG